MSGLRFGIDLGGTKTEIIALAADGSELLRKRTPTPAKSYEAIVANLAEMVHSAEKELGLRGTVGIGIPGAVSLSTQMVKNANTTVLIGRPFHADLERTLDRPVRLANDANCLALSEASDGAGAGEPVVFAAILGTGVGGGLAVHGRILAGCNAIAGEWGHNPLPWPDDAERPGPACYCGQRGCIETFLAGPSVSAMYKTDTGFVRTATEIDRDAKAGVESAELALLRYENRLARALATVINVVDPDVIVVGGGVSKLARLYENVPKLWSAFVFSDAVETRLLPARHGDSSGVRGAAWLWSPEEAR